jgi:hypothetical protein
LPFGEGKVKQAMASCPFVLPLANLSSLNQMKDHTSITKPSLPELHSATFLTTQKVFEYDRTENSM